MDNIHIRTKNPLNNYDAKYRLCQRKYFWMLNSKKNGKLGKKLILDPDSVLCHRLKKQDFFCKEKLLEKTIFLIKKNWLC